MAFGETYDAYFLVCKDGWWSWGGDLPDALIESFGRKPDLACVSLGPDGEWYLQGQDGRSSLRSLGLTDYSQVDALSVLYKSVNFGAEELFRSSGRVCQLLERNLLPGEASWRAQID